MVILAGYMEFYLEWSNSLKEKRAVKQRLQSRLIQDFHLSAMEEQDLSNERDRLGLRYCMLCSDEERAIHFAGKIEGKVFGLTEAALRNHKYEVIYPEI